MTLISTKESLLSELWKMVAPIGPEDEPLDYVDQMTGLMRNTQPNLMDLVDGLVGDSCIGFVDDGIWKSIQHTLSDLLIHCADNGLDSFFAGAPRFLRSWQHQTILFEALTYIRSKRTIAFLKDSESQWIKSRRAVLEVIETLETYATECGTAYLKELQSNPVLRDDSELKTSADEAHKFLQLVEYFTDDKQPGEISKFYPPSFAKRRDNGSFD